MSSDKQKITSNLADQERQDLLKEIKQLKKRKKFGLVWEDKPEDVAEMCKTQLPVLQEVTKKEITGDSQRPTNIIIEGDNYHSLSVLVYTHQKSVDVIYIDPPYNTGNKSWKYNNHFVDEEDSYRHSKWLSFMSKRLRLAKKLLKRNGAICVTIDDYEVFHLGMLMDEIFGEQNRIGVIAMEVNPRGRTTNRFYATSHEYVLVYAKNISQAITEAVPLTAEQEALFKLEDEKSKYRLLPFRRSGGLSTPEERPNSYYPIYFDPKTGEIGVRKQKGSKEIFPVDSTGRKRVWRQTKPSLTAAVSRGDIIIKPNARNGGYTVYMKDRIKLGRKAKTVWINPKYDASSHGTVMLQNILGQRQVFDYPKSLHAVKDVLATLIRSKKDAVVLDFFAGSGTTGHAVLAMNREDAGKRTFILCTNNEDNNETGKGVAQDICYPRIKKVMQGYTSRGKSVKGLGGNLKYFETAFVEQVVTDGDKRSFVCHATEMLCLAENTFEKLKTKKKRFAIYRNARKITAIIYDEDYLDEAKLELRKYKIPIVVYIFSYNSSYNEEDFTDVFGLVKVKPIPAVILNVYSRIVQESARKINV